jgi:5-formyltetrahydrofolate cyclo-ligase
MREAGPDESRPEAPGRGKAEMRRQVLATRDALSPEDRAQRGADICRRASELPELRAASTIMAFASFRSEIDTGALAEWTLGAKKTLCMPRVLGPRSMAAYRVADPSTDLVSGAWGIPEPREGLQEVDPKQIDVVLVPGSVFDAAGRRCGYGGGFYDSYLPLTRPGIPWIGLAFEAQLVEELPCEPHDLSVTAIVTETRVIRPG